MRFVCHPDGTVRDTHVTVLRKPTPAVQTIKDIMRDHEDRQRTEYAERIVEILRQRRGGR